MRNSNTLYQTNSELQSKRLQAIIDTTKDAVWSVDKEFNLLTFNSSFESQVKKPIKIGDNINGAFQLGETTRDYLKAFLGESFIVKKSKKEKGVARTYEISYDPIIELDKVAGCCVRRKDITEKEAILNKLQDSEYKYMEAQQLANVGHWNYDMTTGQILWSDQLFKVFGKECGKFKATYDTLMEIIHPEDREAFNFDVERCIKEDVYHDIVHRILVNNDEIRYVHQRGKAFYDSDGNPIRMAGTTMDVTKTILANQKIVDQNKELQNFVYVISHNLRRPLANLLGLQDLYEKGLCEQNDKVLVLMEQSCKALDGTIKDLNLSLSLKEINLENFKNVSLKKVLEDVSILLDSEIEESGAKMSVEGHHVQMFGIKSYYVNIFYNLILNAIKYSKSGVKPKIKIKVTKRKNIITIAVTDNGIGIELTPDRKKKIFDMYGRLSGKDSGKGLGLYLVKTQVEAMFGEIHVKSFKNRGCTFTLTFDKQFVVTKPTL